MSTENGTLYDDINLFIYIMLETLKNRGCIGILALFNDV